MRTEEEIKLEPSDDRPAEAPADDPTSIAQRDQSDESDHDVEKRSNNLVVAMPDVAFAAPEPVFVEQESSSSSSFMVELSEVIVDVLQQDVPAAVVDILDLFDVSTEAEKEIVAVSQKMFTEVSPQLPPAVSAKVASILGSVDATVNPKDAAAAAAATTTLKKPVNSSFLIAMMAHPTASILSAVLFTASLIFIGVLVTTSALPLSLMSGSLLSALGMFSGSSLWAANRYAVGQKLKEVIEDVLDASPQAAVAAAA